MDLDDGVFCVRLSVLSVVTLVPARRSRYLFVSRSDVFVKSGSMSFLNDAIINSFAAAPFLCSLQNINAFWLKNCLGTRTLNSLFYAVSH